MIDISVTKSIQIEVTENALKSKEKSCENLLFWCQGRPKSTKMAPESTPKAILEADRFQEWSFGAGGKNFLSHRDAFWRIWGVFLGQLGAKGLPKSPYLAPSRSKINKNDA